MRSCQICLAGTVSPCGCSNSEHEKGLGWIWRLPDSSVMEVMNTMQENSNGPQHPAPEHAPWRGNLGEIWRRKMRRFILVELPFCCLCKERGVEKQQSIPRHRGLGLVARTMVCLQEGNVTSLPAGRKGGFYRVPKPSSPSPEQIDPGSWMPVTEPFSHLPY